VSTRRNDKNLVLMSVSFRDNLISAFPACLILSPSLQIVDLSRNSISSISWDNPVKPNREVLQSRKDVSFFDSFPSTPTKSDYRDEDTDELMPSLRNVSFSSNVLTNVGLPQTWPRNVESIDLSENRLQGILDVTALALLPRLKRLNLRGNGLTGVRLQAAEDAVLWPSLETIDLEANDIRAEETLVDALELDRPYTTSGTESRGTVHIVSGFSDKMELSPDQLVYRS
jgi:Leucine-rich repeat (LRR) protein